MLLVYFLMLTFVLCCFFAATRGHCCFWVKHQYCYESKEVFHQRGPHKGSMDGPGSQSNTTKFRCCSDKNLDDICGRPTKLWLYITRPSAGKFPDPHILLPMTLVCGINLYYLWFSAASVSLRAARKCSVLPVGKGVSHWYELHFSHY